MRSNNFHVTGGISKWMKVPIMHLAGWMSFPSCVWDILNVRSWMWTLRRIFKIFSLRPCKNNGAVCLSNAERGRLSCPVSVWVKMLSAGREREAGSRCNLADLACTSVHHLGVRQSLVHLRDEDGMTTLHLEPQSLCASCFWVLLDLRPKPRIKFSWEIFSSGWKCKLPVWKYNSL